MPGPKDDRTPKEETPTATPKEVQPYQHLLDEMKNLYEARLTEKNTEIQTAHKKADEYKASRDLVQTNLNDKNREFNQLKQKLTNADKWYNYWYVKVPATLAFLTLGLFGGEYYEANLGKSGKQTQQINDLSSQLGSYQKEGTLDEFRTCKKSKGELAKENQKYKSDNDKLEQIKWDIQEKLSESKKNCNKLTEDVNAREKEKETCEGSLAKEEKANKELQEKYKVLAQEHEKCKSRILVDIENEGEGLSEEHANLNGYLEVISQKRGWRYTLGNIIVNYDANFDGVITLKDEQHAVRVADIEIGDYRHVFLATTAGDWKTLSEIGDLGKYGVNYEGDIPKYEQTDAASRTQKKLEAALENAPARVIFGRAEFKALCGEYNLKALVTDNGVEVAYGDNRVMAVWNTKMKDDWVYNADGKCFIYRAERLVELIGEGANKKAVANALKGDLDAIQQKILK